MASVPAQAASPSTITGVVTISGTSTPIAGAQVSTQPASSTTTTDSGGNYTLNVTAGTYNVIYAASGFNTDFIAGIVAPPNGSVAANAALKPVPAQAAEDLFSRPDQSGIGTASDGHTWSNDLSKYPNGTVSIV
ncbi:MAG TPA: carboxypeptidase-like regulatory domain-containing protein, partial [Candidatus Dormibacteraeota bacterium]